ncbi:terminase small subunit [Liquorilactobacillus satsumensis]|uniref:terminase small subunit n=1 Tax=Liquorilactobacillus satsumensis TaxID=259059 RepID=UPI0021C45AD0|nr:terminase small subunit [Liquorilactobacillus satsumensis]MCP9357383.1 terminase small subunit [Liquorilactobacillus satsumensis]MCP9372057.1 terminase small subunit [Liquorilactobacillus satsumensis]
MSLNKQQLKFCREYLKSHNAYQSAVKAGYSKSYAKNATKKLLENGGIQDYINKRTEKVEKKEDSEVDEVLTNIYRIASGRPVKRDFVQIDNIKKEISEDTTTTTPAATKEQVAAAELWFKLKGKLKNESKEVETQRVRKLKSDADLAEWKANELTGKNKAADKTVLVNDIGSENNANNNS